MNFYKIFKALNSAQSSWQIALAISFGMISGFVPLLTAINLIIIFIVFTLNIPIGLFILSSALFASIAYLLDPIFASIGFDILTNVSFDGMFTSMYNNAISLWSNFNHTIVLGSTLFSLVLFIPMYFTSKILIEKYRLVFHNKFKDSKFLSFLNPFDEEKQKQKPGIFRWWGAGLMIGIIGLIITFILIFIDPVLKFAIEYSFSKITKKEMTISTLESSFVNQTLYLKNINVKSNNKNKKDISIKLIDINISLEKLLHKNISINEILIEKLLIKDSINKINKNNNTKQNNSNNNINNKIKNPFDKVEIPSVNSILEKENLQSLNKAKQIKKDIDAIYKKYKNFDLIKNNKNKINSLKKEIKNLSIILKNIKNISDLQNISAKAQKIKVDIKKLENEIKNAKKQYKEDKEKINKHLKSIKTLPKEEYEYLKNKYTLDQNGAINILGTYVYDDAKIYINKALKYYELIKPYLKKEELSLDEQRIKGVYIHFKKKHPYPSFVIKKVHGDVAIDDLKYKYLINNISNNQKIYGKIITANIIGIDDKYEKLEISLKHDNINEPILTSINLDIKKYKNNSMSLAKNIRLNEALVNAVSSVSLIDYKTIQASINSNINNTSLNYNSKKTKSNKIVNDVLSNINSFDINAKINGDIKNPSISINSNLDKQINKGFNKVLNKKIKLFKKKLKIKIENKFKNELGNKLANKKFDKIQKLLDSSSSNNSSLKNELKKYLDKDALENKFKNEAKKRLNAKLALKKAKAKKQLEQKKKEEKEKLKQKLKDKAKNLFKSFF